MKKLPIALTFPSFPSITDYDDDGEEEDVFMGDFAEQHLRQFPSASGTDKTVGLRDKGDKFYIGDKEAQIKENNIIFADREYVGTPELWKLIVATTPDDKIVIYGDFDNYAEIMHSTNALRRINDESETKLKANTSWKVKHILKHVWDEKNLYTENGLTLSVPTIILPCDPIVLEERLDILMASKAAGNTGVRNELVSICDELLRKN